MKKIIVISGKQYSGKDTLAQILLDELKDFVRVGIGDAIKISYAKEHNLTFEEIEKNKHLYRGALIELGDCGRKKDLNYWLKSIVNMPQNVIVPDVRVLHEIELFKQYGAYSIRLEADYNVRSKRAVITNADDITETDLDNYKDWDAVVDNNGDLEHLISEGKKLIPKIKEYFN